MAEELFSPSWYRVAALKPRLRAHANIIRQIYRGEAWYVLQDLSNERFHRFSPSTYSVLGLLDGRRTIQEVWELACSRLGDDAPTQDEMIRLLSQLHQADVLQCDVPPDTSELFRRYQQRQRRALMSKAFSFLAWKFPLFDPEKFLTRWLPLVRPFFGWTGALMWLAIVIPGAVLAAMHWPELTENILDLALAPQNLLIVWLIFPILKLLHELGHGFAVKAFGGEVHEMGIMILVLMPIPYVDASSSWAFRSKWQRVAVGAAGMIVEVFLASLALFVWLSVEPGAVRAVAYNVMLIAGISTVLFNANPLLRFDGYYIAADFLEIPNLRQRSFGYLKYLCERYLFGHRDAEVPVGTPGERAWFVTFSTTAFVYRVLVMVAIMLFLGDMFFTVAVILVVFMSVMWIFVPVGKGLKFLLTSPQIKRVRARAIVVTVSLVALIVAGVVLVPAPLRTMAEGVVWIPEEAFVRAEVDGFVTEVVVQPGARVRRGDVLILCENPALATEVMVLMGRLRELRAQYVAERVVNVARAAIIQEELRYAYETLAKARQRLAMLAITSRADGTFVAPLAVDLPGRYVRRGEALAHVVDLETVTVRAVVPQGDIDLVRNRTVEVEVRLAERIDAPLPAVVIREVPAGMEQLPSRALGSAGGGEIPVDPRDPEGVSAVERLFQFDLELPDHAGLLNVGGRVYLRFDHGEEPLATQWYRVIRQLFLTRYNV